MRCSTYALIDYPLWRLIRDHDPDRVRQLERGIPP